MIKFPKIIYVDGNGYAEGNYNSHKIKRYSYHRKNDIVLGLYLSEKHLTRYQTAPPKIYVVKQPEFKKQERQTLVHELCHWIVDKFLGNNKYLHKLVDKNLSAYTIEK